MTYASEVLSDAPDVYYRLDEATAQTALLDSSGNAHTITANSGITSFASLLSADANAATRFDYNAGAFRANSSYVLAQQPLTIEFWVKPISLTGWAGGGESTVITCGTTGGWMISYVDTTGTWRFNAFGVQVYNFTAAAAIAVTRHVVFVYKTDNSVDLYIDGAHSQNVTGSGAMITTSNTLTIGCVSGANAKLPNLYLDEVAIYKAALSAGRITAHYNTAIGAPVSNTIGGLIQSRRGQ